MKKIKYGIEEEGIALEWVPRNDHCHGPCTITFPLFQCVERQIFYRSLFHFYYKKKQKIVLGNSFFFLNFLFLFLPLGKIKCIMYP